MEAPSSPRRARRARRLASIVDAAMAIVEAEGFGALTMQRLASDVDLTPGALYRYFANKDAIVVAMQGRALEEIGAFLADERARRARPDDPGLAALADLYAAAHVYGSLRTRAPRIFFLVSATLADPRPLVDDGEAHRVALPMRDLLEGVSRIFAAATEAGALSAGDPHRRTVVFWSAVQGVTSVAKLDRLAPQWFASRPLIDELAATLLTGWGAQPAQLDVARSTSTLSNPAPTQDPR